MMPKRSLGQNFLLNTDVVEKMALLASLNKEDTVLEIGPGKGILTDAIARHAGNVVAIEKDDVLYDKLEASFDKRPNIRLVHGDILDYNFAELVPGSSKLVANPPYNIASHVLMKVFDTPKYFSSIVIMIQKEVGRRICAPVGSHDYSALTTILGIAFYATPGFVVGSKNFYPRPKVDSIVVKLLPRKEAWVDRLDLPAFKKVVFAAFHFRRKMLKNSLIALNGVNHKILSEIGRMSHIDLNRRPQNLSPREFYGITKAYQALCNR